MGLKSFIKSKFKKARGQPLENSSVVDFFKELGLDVDDVTSQSELCEAIYFICTKVISETVGKMPWKHSEKTENGNKEIIDKNLDYILNIRPNDYMTASSLWTTTELLRQHYGNSYIYIETNNITGELKGLWLLNSDEVTVWVDDAGIIGKKNAIWYVWNDSKTGIDYTFATEEILHFKTSTSFNGITGIPIKEILSLNIDSQKHSQNFLNKLYKANMFGSKVIVYYSGELEADQAKKVAQRMERFSSKVGSGKFLPMPLGTSAQKLDMSLNDAQFFENNKLSALKLAAAFGIKPNMINNYDKSSYSNSETQQLDFFVNSLQPIFTAYEQEVQYKILGKENIIEGKRLEYNTEILFKMDNITKAEVYTKLVAGFIYTPNEARILLGLNKIEGGDKLIGNGSTISIEDIGKQYSSGGE